MRFAPAPSSKVNKKKRAVYQAPLPTRRRVNLPEVSRKANKETYKASKGIEKDSVAHRDRGYRLKVDAARAVGYRETLLMQLNAIVLHWPSAKKKKIPMNQSNTTTINSSTTTQEEASRLLKNVSVELRSAGLRCVESIVAWVLHETNADSSMPLPFYWNGSDYLLKMADDLDFVVDALGPTAWQIASFCKANPLLLTSEEIRGLGPSAKIGRLQAASVIICDIVRRRKRLLHQNSTEKVTKHLDAVQEVYTSNQRPQKIAPIKKNTIELCSPAKIGAAGLLLPSTTTPQVQTEKNTSSPIIPKTPDKENIITTETQIKTEEKQEDKESVLLQDEAKYDTDDFFEEDTPPPDSQSVVNSGITSVVSSQAAIAADDDDSTRKVSSLAPSETSDCIIRSGSAAYDLERLLGEGAYGEVYSARHMYTGARVAIKKLKLAADGDDEDEEMAQFAVATAERELSVLRTLDENHPNIVRFVDSWLEDMDVMDMKVSAPALVFELLSMTALEALEQQNGNGFSRKVCVSFLVDLCSALSHLHSLNVIHRDVKPENVLLTAVPDDETMPVLKLCDFGAARQLPTEATKSSNHYVGGSDLTHYIGSRWYRAPEMMVGCTRYSLSVDVWSAGCIMAEFATGDPLFSGEDEHSVLARIAKMVGPFPKRTTADLIDRGVPVGVICVPKHLRSDLKDAFSGRLLSKIGMQGIEILTRMLDIDANSRITAVDCGEAWRSGSLDQKPIQIEKTPVENKEETAKVAADTSKESTILAKDVAALPCWSVAGIDTSFKESWLPVLEAGVAAVGGAPEKSKAQAIPGISSSFELFPRAADALTSVPIKSLEEWLISLRVNPVPLGVLRVILRTLRWTVDTAVSPKVTVCREWLLAQQQRSEVSLLQTVEALEAQLGDPESVASRRANVAASLLQFAYQVVLHPTDTLNDRKIAPPISISAHAILPMLSMSDIIVGSELAAESSLEMSGRADQGIGSDIGARQPLSSHQAESLVSNIEERFHIRSLNEALALVTPMLLDTEVDALAKAHGIERFVRLLGLPSLQSHAALIRPASKAALLYVELSRRSMKRLNLVTSRDTVWEDFMKLMMRQADCLNAAAHKSCAEEQAELCDGLIVGNRSGNKSASTFFLDEAADFTPKKDNLKEMFVICPYYRSPFGQKHIDGITVEEGEGLGPRKELFSLLASYARQNWMTLDCDARLFVAPRAHSDARNVVRIRAENTLAVHFRNVLRPGNMIAIEASQAAEKLQLEADLHLVIEQVLEDLSSSNEVLIRISTSSTELRQAIVGQDTFNNSDDKIVDFLDAIVDVQVVPRAQVQPMLIDRPDLDSLWLNPRLPKTEESARRLATLGLIFGSTVTNQCQVPLEFPTSFFHVLGVAEDCPAHERVERFASVPCLTHRALFSIDCNGSLALDESMLKVLDHSYAESKLAIHNLNDAQFAALLELEGFTLETLVKDAVIRQLNLSKTDDIRSVFTKRQALLRCSDLEWQLRALRRGFERTMPADIRRSVRPSAHDVQRIVCGAPEHQGDFRFRDVFRIVMDSELRKCLPLHDALWAVIDGEDEPRFPRKDQKVLTTAQRRKLLKFITGVERLPERNTEFLTVELPFLPFGAEEQRRMLAMIPQSHTCDNILELPNYWEALLNTKLTPGSKAPERDSLACDELECELRSILYEKLLVAIDNASGYGLDALESQGGGGHTAAAPEMAISSAAVEEDDYEDDAEAGSIPTIPGLEEDSHFLNDDKSTQKIIPLASPVALPIKDEEDVDDYDDEFEESDEKSSQIKQKDVEEKFKIEDEQKLAISKTSGRAHTSNERINEEPKLLSVDDDDIKNTKSDRLVEDESSLVLDATHGTENAETTDDADGYGDDEFDFEDFEVA